MPDPILLAEALEIGYVRPRQPARLVVGGIDVRLEPGELVCLLGPNGAGKSTLLRTIAGMQPALAGTIRLLGDEVGRLDARELARRMSIVLTERVSAGGLSAMPCSRGPPPYTAGTAV
jgi:iron complex transport system ATP-binding protein